MTREKPLPRLCECGCGEPLAQRESRNGGPRRVFSRACERRLAKQREAAAKEERAIHALKQRARYTTDSNRETCATYRATHRDEYNAAHRAYYAENRERLNALRRARKTKGPEPKP